MRTVTVDLVHLRDRVAAGRAKHLKEFAEAKAKYRLAVQKQAAAIAKHAASKAPTPTYGYRLQISPPENRAEDFDRVLAQLDASTDINVTLDEGEFDRLWRGQWEFSGQLRAASMEYGKAARSTKFR